jgi:hypothetical protein
MRARLPVRAILLFCVSPAVLTAWACSSSDQQRTLLGEAGAGGQEAEGGASGDTGGVGTSGTDEGSDPVAGASAGGGAPPDPQAGAAGVGEAGGQSGCVPTTGAGGDGGADGSRVIYTNDFETPNQPLTATCGNSLDASGINALYGTPSFVFQQINTVEGVVVDDPAGLYEDPSGVGKRYSLGMLSTAQDDLLSLTFDVPGRSFLNVGMDLSSIDVSGCGGPFGVAVPVMQVRLYDTPTGAFSFAEPGTLLAQGTITGVTSPDPWTFTWTFGVVSLDATGATGKALTVVFDLQQSGYAGFDNLSIVAAERSGVVDSNNDGIPDDQQCLP